MSRESEEPANGKICKEGNMDESHQLRFIAPVIAIKMNRGVMKSPYA